MRIHFVRAGGFANIELGVTLDTDAMSRDQAREVVALVEAVDWLKLPATFSSGSSMADAFTYHIDVADEGRRHAVDVSGTPPSQLESLIDYLTDAAKEARKARRDPPRGGSRGSS